MCGTFGLVLLGLQLQNAALLHTNPTAAQQLLQGGAEGGVDGLRRLDGEQQDERPQVLARRTQTVRTDGLGHRVCVCVLGAYVRRSAGRWSC